MKEVETKEKVSMRFVAGENMTSLKLIKKSL
jgi:hypothetical protein